MSIQPVRFAAMFRHTDEILLKNQRTIIIHDTKTSFANQLKIPNSISESNAIFYKIFINTG